MDKEKTLRKIKSCLALSESSNIEEANSALLKAQELMIKYRISEDDVKNFDKEKINKRVSVITVITETNRIFWYVKDLGSVIAENFKVVAFSSGNREMGKSFKFMGLEEDVEIAQEVFSFALEKMKELADKETKSIELQNEDDKKVYKSSSKNDFYRGFIDGLNKAFKDQVNENDWGLVLVKDELVIKAMEKLNLKSVKKANGIPPKFSNNKNLYNEGYKHGNNFGTSFNNGNSIEGD